MTFDPVPPSEPEAAPAPAPRRRLFGRVPRAALTMGLAVGLALGSAGIAFAATSGSSSTTTPSTKPSTNAPGHALRPFGPRGLGPGLGFAGLRGGKVIHASYTVQTGNGTYKTIEVQTGMVTARSSTSITLKSADGYKATYAVDPATVVNAQRDGINSVAVNDQVNLEATPVSSKITATNIVDTTKIGASRNGFGFTPPAGSNNGSKAGSANFGGFGPGGPAAPTQPQ